MHVLCCYPLAGTGKTATVLASVKHLRSDVEQGLLRDFAFIEINCLRLKSPSDACKCDDAYCPLRSLLKLPIAITA